jgi:transcriptional regulator of acetoin/glycerol metabolism
MATNPWFTIDATTWPLLRARELRVVWEEYLSDGDQVRRPVAESWRRSEVAGIDPSRSRAPTILADRRDVEDRWEGHPLMVAAPLIRRWLGPLAAASEHLIVVSDAEGLLLWLDGNARVRSAAADAMNFVEGALWSEAGAGTNAIGTALATDHAVQVHAAEHFSEVVHGWTCSAVPVHDPEDGRLLGLIDLTGLMANRRADLPHRRAAARTRRDRRLLRGLRVTHERPSNMRVRRSFAWRPSNATERCTSRSATTVSAARIQPTGRVSSACETESRRMRERLSSGARSEPERRCSFPCRSIDPRTRGSHLRRRLRRSCGRR